MDEISITLSPTVQPIDWLLPGSQPWANAWRRPSKLGLLSPTGLPVGGAEIAHNVRCPELDRARAGPKSNRGRDHRERRYPPAGDSWVADFVPSACVSLPHTQERGMEQA
jgi:hypothetical protein